MDSLPLPPIEGQVPPSYQGAWLYTVQPFTQGGFEGQAVWVDMERLGRQTDTPRKRRSGAKSEADIESLERSAFRARKNVRQLARELAPKLLFTNTTRNLLPTEDAAKAAWARFVLAANKRTHGEFSKWGWLCVLEQHKSGMFHIHWITSKDFINVDMLRACWKKALGGKAKDIGEASPGNVQYKRLHRGGQVAASVASYISKYITKQDVVALNRKRYIVSKGLRLQPRHRRWLKTAGTREEAYLEIVEGLLAMGCGASDLREFFVPGRSVVWISYAPAESRPPPF